MAKVSVIIPSRNEQFLDQTVADLLTKASGDLEVVVIADGYWPEMTECWQACLKDKRLKILHRGKAQGMRPGINAAVEMASGEYLLKADAHTMWDEGFDEKLKADYLEDNWILTPRRYALDAETWAIDSTNPKYPIDYEYLSYGMERPEDPTCGFHGTPWTTRRDARQEIMLDEDLSGQGSAYMLSRKQWERVGPLNIELFGNFFCEMQEVGLSTQLQGGKMMRTKNTWYAHLRKGAKHGRGYALGVNGHRRGAGAILRMCMLDQWPRQTKTLKQVLEPFMPVPSWPLDLDQCFRDARAALMASAV